LEEHCLEAQLPFVQHLFPSADILPILLGKPTRILAQLLTDSLWKLYARRMSSTLFVVTANMTSNVDEKSGDEEAERVISWITEGDWRSLIDAAESGSISSCGAGCVAAILQMNDRLGGRISILRKGSSLPMVKDPKKVVHYAAFMLEK
jgi:AmmeMemoRadiSam system protein B